MTNEELRRRVDAALAEVGYGGHARPAGPTAPAGSRFVITRGAVPSPLIHKALALSTLQAYGPEAPIRCWRHCSVLHRGACPRYPVGALLAGTITGCNE